MFDVNPDAAKYYLKDLERQVGASRLPRGVPSRAVESNFTEMRPDTLVAAYGRLSARVFASVVRGVAAAIF